MMDQDAKERREKLTRIFNAFNSQKTNEETHFFLAWCFGALKWDASLGSVVAIELKAQEYGVLIQMQTLTCHGFVPMFTPGFQGLNSDVQAKIIHVAFKRIHPDKPDMIVFKPEGSDTEHLEDEGRTLVVSIPGLDAKVYTKLDDFGSPEALRENMGQFAVQGNIQRVLTLMLAREY